MNYPELTVATQCVGSVHYLSTVARKGVCSVHYQSIAISQNVGSAHYQSTVVSQSVGNCDVYYKSTLAGQDKALVACTTNQL